MTAQLFFILASTISIGIAISIASIWSFYYAFKSYRHFRKGDHSTEGVIIARAMLTRTACVFGLLVTNVLAATFRLFDAGVSVTPATYVEFASLLIGTILLGVIIAVDVKVRIFVDIKTLRRKTSLGDGK